VQGSSSSSAAASAPKCDPRAELDDALAHVHRYRAFIHRLSPNASFEPPNLMVARASVQAMEAAQRGFDALAQLPSSERLSTARREARALLDAERLNGALRFLVLRDHEVQPPVRGRGP
jgi:hypothetical protein